MSARPQSKKAERRALRLPAFLWCICEVPRQRAGVVGG
jgi:hypothetical protein